MLHIVVQIGNEMEKNTFFSSTFEENESDRLKINLLFKTYNYVFFVVCVQIWLFIYFLG